MLTRLFLAVWRMSVSGAAAALVIWLAVLILRQLRAPRAVCCALWLAVLVRLLCPVGFASAISIFNAPGLGHCVEALQGEAAVLGYDETAWQDTDAAGQAGLPPAGPHTDISGPLPENGALFATDAAALAQPAAPDAAIAIGPDEPDTLGTQGTPSLSLRAALPLLALLWLAGALGMALHGLAGAARLRRQVAPAFKVEGEPGVYTGEQIAEPFAFGILRPRICLPLGLTQEEQRIILLHERAHLRRRDNLVKPLFYAALCLHWFNPLAWLAFRGMAGDMEAACDEAVLRAAGGGVKAAYCRSLLRFCGPRARAAAALSFGEGQVSGRVRAVLGYRRPAFWAAAAAALAAILLAAACMADPIADRVADRIADRIADRAAEPADASGAAGADEPPAQSIPAESGPADSTPEPGEPDGGGPDEGEPAEGLPGGDALENTEYPAGDPGEAAADDPGFVWPVPDYECVTRWMDGYHKGADIVAGAGTPIVAAADGEVITAMDHFSYGNYLVIDHGDGWRTLYAHCDILLVQEGDTVTQGQQIAAVGSTGNTNSNICHFEIYLGGTRLSARDFFSGMQTAGDAADAGGSMAEGEKRFILARPRLTPALPGRCRITAMSAAGCLPTTAD